MTNFEKVRHWMRIAGQNVPDRVQLVDGKTLALRKRLMREEMLDKDELFDSMDAEDLEGIADGLADLLYVVYGTAVAYGIDADKIFDIVHENNLSKFDLCPRCAGNGAISHATCPECNGHGWIAILDAGGKVMKNPTWEPPNLKPALGLQ